MSVLTRERIEELYRELMGDEREEDPERWAKRMRILRAATELFVQNGYRKTTVDEIARRAEVAKGTVYLYFPNKGALLVQCVALEKRAMFEMIAPILDGSMPEKRRLHFMLKQTLRACTELPLVARLLRDDAELTAALQDAGTEMLESRMAIGEAWLSELIEQAAPGRFTEEEKLDRVHVLIHARYFTRLMVDDPILPGPPLPKLAETLADIVVHGLIHRPPEDEEE